jgi:hypothetical protein
MVVKRATVVDGAVIDSCRSNSLLGTCNGGRRERHEDIDEMKSSTLVDKEA